MFFLGSHVLKMFSLLYMNQNFRTQIDPAEEPTSPADSVATLLPDDFEVIPVEPEGHEEKAKDTMTTEEKEKKLAVLKTKDMTKMKVKVEKQSPGKQVDKKSSHKEDKTTAVKNMCN